MHESYIGIYDNAFYTSWKHVISEQLLLLREISIWPQSIIMYLVRVLGIVFSDTRLVFERIAAISVYSRH